MLRAALLLVAGMGLSFVGTGETLNAAGGTSAGGTSINDTVRAPSAPTAEDRDTVLVLKARDRETEERYQDSLDEARERADEERESRGVGAATFCANLVSLDTRAIEKIARNERDLAGKTFDFRNNKFLTLGVMGYGGPRHGILTGAGVWGGYKVFYSDEYATRLADGSVADSVAALHVALGCVTFLAEKHFTFFDRLDLIGGGMIGGGALVVVKDFRSAEELTSFQGGSSGASVEDSAGVNVRVAVTPVWAFDLHAGLSYRFAPWLSIGIEGNAVFLYSSNGFGYGYGSFGSVNPGGRMRIVLGNAG